MKFQISRPGGDVRQERVDRLAEQRAVEDAHRRGDDAHADADPQRPEHRAAVALLDVLPAQVAPQRALPPAAARGRRTRAASCADPGRPAAPAPAADRRRRPGAHRWSRVAPRGEGTDGVRQSGAAPWSAASAATALQVLAGAPAEALRQRLARRAGTRRQPAAHLLQLRPRRHLLGEQRRLDAVEQALQPADQLGLRDPQLGVAGGGVVGERQCSAGSARRAARAPGPPPARLTESGQDLARAASREASSSGAARTSSSSCLIIVPIRMTLAGCSTMAADALLLCSSPSSDCWGTRAIPSGRPSGPTTITCCSPSPSP